ncbi:hypothetical protein [Halobaculum marinum]|uniref:Cox cluster protein n=1 Tax=Halobaculum marinum TaxID=3031996 RepID=A0ABD5WYV2_9EURY|nr:hypothetical protein [Halobaculum sp. DT55]
MTDDTPRPTDSAVDDLGGALVAYRLAIYLGGLAVIGLPLALREAVGVTVPPAARTALTVTTIAVMVVTYLFERRLGIDGDHAADTGGATAGDGGYPLGTRAAIAVAVLGLAAGVYVTLEVSVGAGLLFVGGAYLFAFLAYGRGDAPEADTETEPDGGVS